MHRVKKLNCFSKTCNELRNLLFTVVSLPVDDADKFCEWCLREFEYEGQTIFMAPASGFYTTKGVGSNEVRMAYVLNKEDLSKALKVLAEALKAYPGRTNL